MLLKKLKEKNKMLLLEMEMLLASVDNNVDVREEQVIKSHSAEMGIDVNELSFSKRSIEEVVHQIAETADDSEKKIILLELTAVALADEEFLKEEKAFIYKVGELLKIDRKVTNQAIELMTSMLENAKKIEEFAK